MKTSNAIRLTSLLAFASSAGSLSALAQNADQSNPSPPAVAGSSPASADQAVVLSPFVVSSQNEQGYASDQSLAGSRVAANLLDLSSAITIINKQLISDFEAPDIQHVLGYGVSGVTANQTTYDDVYIRGFRMPNSMREGIEGAGYAPSPLYDVDRVEVIKGPVALVLGDNAYLGGALNYIPRAPTAAQAGEVNLGYYAFVDGKEYLRATINDSGPAYQSNELNVLYRVTVGGENGDASKAIENHNQQFVGGHIVFNFGSNSSLSIDAYRYLNNDRWGYNDFLDNRYTHVAVLNPYSTATFSPGLAQDDPQRSRTTNLNVTFLTKVSKNGNLRLAFAYNAYGYTSGNLAGDTLAADNYTLTPALTRYDEKDTQGVIQGDYLHRVNFTNFGNDFSAGFDYRATTSWGGEGPYFVLPAIDTRNPSYAGETAEASLIAQQFSSGLFPSNYEVQSVEHTLSYYAQDSVSFLNDRVIIVGALRWFQSVVTNADNVAGTFGETDNPPLQVHKYGAVIKPFPWTWMSLYYVNATSEIPVVGYDNENVPQPYKNQQGKDSEGGIKFDKKLTENFSLYGSAAYFNMALTNIKENTGLLNSAGEIIVEQVAEDTNEGWEFDLGTRFKYDSGFVDLIVTGYRGDALTAGGGPARADPDSTASVLIKHTWTGTFLRGLMIGGGGHQTGVKYANGYNIYTPNLYDLFAGYQITKRWDVQLDWYNIRNSRYVTAFASPAEVMTGMPGTVVFSTRYRW